MRKLETTYLLDFDKSTHLYELRRFLGRNGFSIDYDERCTRFFYEASFVGDIQGNKLRVLNSFPDAEEKPEERLIKLIEDYRPNYSPKFAE